ncbi:MAG: hypothetical protein ABI678_28110, partial [Kofleriaceae bacterium]
MNVTCGVLRREIVSVYAIRFIRPNNRIKKGFVPPATHATGTTGTGDLPYYGVHLRLRANGNIALTAQSDRHTTYKWAGQLNPRDLSTLKVDDFEVVDHGACTPLTYDCV